MSPSSGPSVRRYRDEEDYWRIREFLRQVFLLNGRRELSWQAYRFDYWRWHGTLNLGDGTLEKDVFLWEEPDGRIAAVLNRESAGVAFLQVHPALRTAALEEEMIDVAEEHLTVERPAAPPRPWVLAAADDDLRRGILARRGYTRRVYSECHHCRPLSAELPDAPLPQGYTVRSLGGDEELPSRSWASFRAFHPDAPEDEYGGWEWYGNVQRAPLYRRDLDVVAVAPNGEVAAFCTVWFDDVTRTGAFEPVGTVPAHQRRGLGRAVIAEGLRRVQRLGATLATVGSEAPGPQAFYTAAGFADGGWSTAWSKEP